MIGMRISEDSQIKPCEVRGCTGTMIKTGRGDTGWSCAFGGGCMHQMQQAARAHEAGFALTIASISRLGVARV